jgi:hypothetical protein
MAKREVTREQFDARRRKEQLAFLVVKFFRAFVSFQSINADFGRLNASGCLAGCGLFDRVRELAESLVFDLKEKAHYLFRNAGPNGSPTQKTADIKDSKDARRLIAGMKSNIETRSIDSYIGTGYHLLQILQESLYQIERYTPELEKEKGEISRILELARSTGYKFSLEERAELERLKALDEISVKLASEAEELALRIMERCETLFAGTADVIRNFVISQSDNEILILNLLEHQDLVERVYGQGASETIFWELCRGRGFTGRSGLERAVNFARARCGNTSAIPAAAGGVPAGASSPAAARQPADRGSPMPSGAS